MDEFKNISSKDKVFVVVIFLAKCSSALGVSVPLYNIYIVFRKGDKRAKISHIYHMFIISRI